MKIGCIIQGDIRENFDFVCREIIKHFDIIIVSTWVSEIDKVKKIDNIHYIFNELPEQFGFSNRNLQRLSTSKGIDLARQLNCDYVLKWRTDMLPLKLDVNKLLTMSNFNLPNQIKSRIVTCAFRNLTVSPDWFSSIPDLFSFGHIDMMELLWSDDNIDYSKNFNFPKLMQLEVGSAWLMDKNIIGNYCAETELYAVFKDRMSDKLNRKLTHENIIKEFFYLFNHEDLGILWFGKNKSFRPILALYYPWWTIKTWMGKKNVEVISYGYPASFYSRILMKIIVPILTYTSNIKQKSQLVRYLKNNIHNE